MSCTCISLRKQPPLHVRSARGRDSSASGASVKRRGCFLRLHMHLNLSKFVCGNMPGFLATFRPRNLLFCLELSLSPPKACHMRAVLPMPPVFFKSTAHDSFPLNKLMNQINKQPSHSSSSINNIQSLILLGIQGAFCVNSTPKTRQALRINNMILSLSQEVSERF